MDDADDADEVPGGEEVEREDDGEGEGDDPDGRLRRSIDCFQGNLHLDVGDDAAEDGGDCERSCRRCCSTPPLTPLLRRRSCGFSWGPKEIVDHPAGKTWR